MGDYMTYPEIQFAVGQLTRIMHKSTYTHIEMARDIMRYLKEFTTVSHPHQFENQEGPADD